MRATYRAAPTMTCSAPAKSFARPLEALQFARQATDAFRVAYSVYAVLRGRLKRLETFQPADRRA